ncbi:ferrous iron transport protein B [Thiofaba sp. EF100]|uniref:ferrous iron transport protein B n=1 Tax=Thiofaba sp. EF100 TaxID=3121274 RepID=UPI003221DCF3
MARRIALLGMPNTGKSTLFNRLTGASARTGNWPGLTVELSAAQLPLGSDLVELVDLPGIYDLHGMTEDEHVVRRFLERVSVDVLVVVLNAAQIDRQLPLLLQARALGLPMLAVLNMRDEAERFGVTIDVDRLGESLGFPVLAVSARRAEGMGRLRQAMAAALREARPVPLAELAERLAPEEVVQEEAEALLRVAVKAPHQLSDRMSERLDRILLHRIWGLPIFFLSLFLLFQFIFTLGAPLQDAVEWALGLLRDGLQATLADVLPAFGQGLLFEGIYDGLATVASFLPVIALFFIVMSAVEDSGYLARAAFLVDGFMARLGLDGRGFVLHLFGMGCNVPAVMGTRVMRSPGLRALTMLVLPFSLCAARLQVFLFFVAVLFAPNQAAIVLFSLYLLSLLAAMLTAWLFKRRYNVVEPVILELPPYRLPVPGTMFRTAGGEIAHFLRRATRFIVLGVVAIWLLTHLPWGVQPAGPESYAGRLGQMVAGVFAPLGFDPLLALALLFGFVAKEVVLGGLAVLYGVGEEGLGAAVQGHMDAVQAMSFMLFTLLYTPCVSTLAAIRAESRSWRLTFTSVLWSLSLAYTVSLAFYQTARWMGF